MEKCHGEVGDRITFDKVLLVSDGEKVDVGHPYLESTKVVGRILRQGRDKKIVVFKYKKRKKYRRKQGHRQAFTLVRIDNIENA
jgi:large subunit ribosomal protein L21